MFYKFKEEKGETDQHCMEKLYDLMENELGLQNARAIQFHRVHRVGRYNRTKTRPIVAKFAFYPDRERVRAAAKNLEGTNYSIGQQFPKEIQDRRRRLVPLMKKAKGEGKQAYISVDKLYIDGTQYVVKTDPIQPLATPAGATAITVEPAVVAAGIHMASEATSMDTGATANTAQGTA